jgi:hypothetical protein
MKTQHILAVAMLAVVGADPPATRPLPISAHNCYPNDSLSREPLEKALALGIDNIEIDLGWDADGKRLIVGHDAKPRPGVAYPELETYLVPVFEAHSKRPREDGAPSVLSVDWKTSEPEAVARFKAFLDAHDGWFSSASKAEPSPLTKRRLTVCFTGSEAAKRQYDALIPAGGAYRAFSDRVFGGAAYREDVTDYAPIPASAYNRFITLAWQNVERGAPPLAKEWTPAAADRLRAIVEQVHRQGYRARFYCLDRPDSSGMVPYHFPTAAAAITRWKAAAVAGADWVASDDYAEIVRELRR